MQEWNKVKSDGFKIAKAKIKKGQSLESKLLWSIIQISRNSFGNNHMQKNEVDAFRTNQCGSSSGLCERSDPNIKYK